MLKGIDPRLNADVLYALRDMGHGDYIILSDTNFPAGSVATETVAGTLLRMENLTAAQAAEAILSVFPLETEGNDFAARMQVGDDPSALPPVQAEVQELVNKVEGKTRPLLPVERFDFYDLARNAYAVIQTGDRRFFGCFMFRMGVIAPDADDQ